MKDPKLGKRKITGLLRIFFALVFLAASVVGVSAEAKKYTIGYVQAGSSIYWQLSAEGSVAAGKLAGMDVKVLNSNGNPQTELSNIEDFIAKKVDAIIVFTTNGETSQQGAQLANEAGIPFFIVGSAAADGPGKVTCTIKGDFHKYGRMIGDFIAKNYPDAKLGLVEGPYGQGIAELFTQGIQEGLEGSNVVLVAHQQADVNWSRQSAMAVAQNMITAHPEINLLFANNEDMAAGVVEAVKEAGLTGKVLVITHNGQPLGMQMLETHQIVATQANSPTNEAGIAMIAIYKYLHGDKLPPVIESPAKIITLKNIKDAYGWQVSAATRIMKEYLDHHQIIGFGKEFTF